MANEYVVYALDGEVLHSGAAATPIQVYALSSEVLHSGVSLTPVLLYALHAEVLHGGNTSADDRVNIYSLAVEVLRDPAQGFFPSFLDEGDSIYLPIVAPDINTTFLDEGDTVYLPSLTLFILPLYYDPFLASETEVFSIRIEIIEPRPPLSLPYEWNPFRPDVPHLLAESDPPLYDYLREQAELIREQHNSTQAGDTTFPWQMFTDYGDRAEHTLGSVSRFAHEDYGLLQGRYVKFSDNWTPGENPIVGHDKTLDDWTVTNQAGFTTLFRVAGVAAAYLLDLSNRYGWVLTQGRGPFPIIIENATQPTQFARFTWSPAAAGIALIGAGPQVGTLLAATYAEALKSDSSSYSPKRWLVPAGSWYADVQGVTDEYIAETAELGLADLTARIAVLEAATTADYAAAIAALQTSVTNLQANLTTESTTRTSADSGLSARIAVLEALGIGGFVTLPVFDALKLRVTTLESQYTTVNTTLSALSASTDLRLDNLESWRTTATTQINGLTTALGNKANLTGDTFTGTVNVPDLAYDATTWNASMAVPTRNAVRDKIEDILDGVGFTGAITVPDAVYDATTWNGSVEVPTKNAIRDKIEDILDGVTFTGAISVPDAVYDAASWNGSLEVPTKNAVRDKIETLGAGSDAGLYLPGQFAILPVYNSATPTIQGNAVVTAATTAEVFAATNYVTKLLRVGLLPATAANSFAQCRSGGHFEASLGWSYKAIVGIQTALASSRLMIGSHGNWPGNADISPTFNLLALAKDSADSNLQIMHNDGAGVATKIDLGVNFPAATAGAAYLVELVLAAGGASATYSVTRLDAAFSASGTISTDLPVAGTIYSAGVWNGTGAAGGTVKNAVGIIWGKSNLPA